ncbi:LysR family transcriptional regulator [Ochrobactrum quorumnocens]|jgi:DNA-binding transcriptional LysR family regulator|uniref:LysR family transcriptional regulator n=1 Tax=Ochrobactrum quorumnocens TaxID=271865 RepID=A0A5N1K9U7_9HYPH|nr:LysR family transcriptional regulator [[Ochrobactrum] quorumnocens]KAA9370035.1 LysR family transcriptional regulator [[Ochrobactrum] quorumnocens]
MISNERFNGIRAFVQAEQSGSFSAASTVLGLSQSAVSKSVARLEDRLGVRLFHRTTRSLSLTDEGRVYLESCRRALEELANAEIALSSRIAVPSGRVRINLPDLFGRKCVAPLLMQLAQAHPQLHFEVSFENRVVNLIEEGYDLAVRIGDLPDSTDLISKRVGQQDVIICASPSYISAYGKPSKLSNVQEHFCVTQFRGGRNEPWVVLNENGEKVRCDIRSNHSFAAFDMIVDAAIAGLGLVQVPRWLVEDELLSGALVQVLPDMRTPSLPIHIIWLGGRVLASRVRATIDAIANGLR